MKKIFIIILVFLHASFSFSDGGSEERMNKLRLMHGWGFLNTLEDLVIKGVYDKYESVTEFGLSYERYLSKDIWDKRMELSLQLGYIRHDDNDGNYINQYNLGLKAYWIKFPWSDCIRTKLFTVAGLSYTDEILRIEYADNDLTSHLLCYLEFGVELNLGDLLRTKTLDSYYFGGGISHRSGAYGTFNGVHGGSNYLMLFVEKEF